MEVEEAECGRGGVTSLGVAEEEERVDARERLVCLDC